ncbi:MaoC family dehydratase [Pseudomonas sp. S 311-6]|uniref:Dehydratase n=1 Tax=Kerstersia gyiorum TaxID=206506 RepID=A0A171KS90_9BURK|nr:MaoC family dehydratase [Kerstersia gyiorum]MCO7637777.1 MaoC family dehydratase [Pseudomonas sp. S 311-6]KAB0541573.1 MaoC family dehydratase [Kerstersia gyiorum]KKO71757.1 dehydratase [Kerstersia gyiorum]MCR4158709.1 MaoC family dehydratase [Kerstersia gyiorum]QBR41037.1 MaoC family dehydratase [Kerstersia gyiorum]
MTKQNKIYLEDIEIGTEFRSAEHALDVAQVIGFAQQFDPQVFHLDEDAARQTFFQGLAASGWHTAAITMKLLVQSIPVGNGLIGAGVEVAWPQPTRPNDVLRVVSTVKQIQPSRSKPDRAIVIMECLTLNQRDEVCQRMTVKTLVMRRPAG